jgi:urease accessory protein UreF
LQATDAALGAELESMGSSAFELDIAMMRQRHADARLFAT